jgi:dienelactone hydrolase
MSVVGLSVVVAAFWIAPKVKNRVDAYFAPKIVSYKLGDIPIIYIQPHQENRNNKLVIWLDGFSGKKERTISYLKELAAEGFTAVSYDASEHGERSTESREVLWDRVFGDFRKGMWPIIANTSYDAQKVIDWAIKELKVDPNNVGMGGFSMGGDIAVTVAGLDNRVKCVAAIVSTPDWERPGMKDFSTPPMLIDQGEADKTAQTHYETLNPLTHLENYDHLPAITFEMGSNDVHIPVDGALRFQEALQQSSYALKKDKIRVTVHSNVHHEFDRAMWTSSLQWFVEHCGK